MPNTPFLTPDTTIDEVSLWDRPLQPDELDAMYNAFAPPNNPLNSSLAAIPPPPPSQEVPPGAPQLRLPGTDQAGGLPPQLLEAAGAYAHLLTAYVNASSGTIYSQCYQSDPTQPNPSQMLQTVLTRVGPGLRLARVLQDQASELASAPGAPNAVWYPRYQADLQQLAGEIHGTLAALHQVSACKNPLGIDEGQIPLYIGDATGLAPVDRFFAGTRALISLMSQNDNLQGELTLANEAIAQARAAYIAQQQTTYQATLVAADRTMTLNNLHQQYETALRKYCGVPTGTNVLDGFLNHTLNVDNCFLATDRQGCGRAATLAIKDIPAECLRGDMGARILAVQTATRKTRKIERSICGTATRRTAWSERRSTTTRSSSRRRTSRCSRRFASNRPTPTR